MIFLKPTFAVVPVASGTVSDVCVVFKLEGMRYKMIKSGKLAETSARLQEPWHCSTI